MDNDKLLGNMYEELNLSNQENAIKLDQILNLEKILYATFVVDMNDGSPCWCVIPALEEDSVNIPHEKFCEDARNATKHLWSK